MHPFAGRWRSGRILERQILLAVLAIVAHPLRALIIAGVALGACATLALTRLDISSDQNKLFSNKVKFFQDYLEFDREFPENEAVYIVIEALHPADPPPVARWIALADAITANLRRSPSVQTVDSHIPLEQLGTQAILFEPSDRLRSDFADVIRFGALAKLWGENPTGLSGILGRTPMERFLKGASFQAGDPEATGFVRLLADHWNRTLLHSDEPIKIGQNVPNLVLAGAQTPQDLGYYYVQDETNHANHLLIVRAFPKANYDSLTSITTAVAAIRAGSQSAASNFSNEFKVGVTGRPALDADEMETTDRDSTRAEILAAIAVFIGLVVMLRSIWLALAAEIALGVAIGWTFGWATVSVGELNLLSIVFLIALIGIGMDYLVQVLTRYRSEARRHARPKAIWARVFRHVAAPINTACFGAAGAFLVAIFTDFQGAADLGIIAGGGLLLCLLSGYTVLPAMLTLIPARVGVDVALRAPASPPQRGARRLILPVIWLLGLAVLVPFIPRTQFNPNLLDLQAPQLESTKLIRKLQTWSAVVLTKDLGVLRQAQEAVQHLRPVAGTESILIAEDNQRWLAEHQGELPKINWVTPPIVEAPDLASIAGSAKTLADRIQTSGGANLATHPADSIPAAQALRQFADLLGSADPQLAARRLSQWQAQFVDHLRELLSRFSPAPLDLAKVPVELRSHYVSSDGTFALYIEPKFDLWNRTRLKDFVTQVESAIQKLPNPPVVTGIAPDIYHTTRAIRTSFIRATVYALALIVLLVLLDLHDIPQTLLAISVLGLGLPMLVGLMGFLGLDWNFANFFGLPILIGAGHEYGVFMIHRYREQLHDPRRVWKSWDVADRALLLCAYVTCSSFAFFGAVGHHRGLKSLGIVMALGTACIYLSAIMVLRPLLKWVLEREMKRAALTSSNPALP